MVSPHSDPFHLCGSLVVCHLPVFRVTHGPIGTLFPPFLSEGRITRTKLQVSHKSSLQLKHVMVWLEMQAPRIATALRGTKKQPCLRYQQQRMNSSKMANLRFAVYTCVSPTIFLSLSLRHSEWLGKQQRFAPAQHAGKFECLSVGTCDTAPTQPRFRETELLSLSDTDTVSSS